ASKTTEFDIQIAPSDILGDYIVKSTIRDIVSAVLYIANRSSREVHRSDCFWVTQMKDINKVPCGGLGGVAELIKDSGYNGCFYCLPRYDRDTLTEQQVLTNLEEDLGR
ncbi:unnamed protein product, partial [marine sediment metagenome]